MSTESSSNASTAAPERLRAMLTGSARDFWRCLPDLLYFDITFKAIAFLLLAPPLAWLFQRFIASSGAEAVGNFDIAAFLLTPLGASILLVLVALGLTLTLLELGGLIVIGCGALADRRVTYVEALRWIASCGLRLVAASLLILVILAVLLLPFALAALFTASRLLTAHDINYYLAEHPPEFRQALAIGGVLAVVAAALVAIIGVRLAFVFPELLVSKCELGTAFRRSWQLGRGQWRRVFTALLAASALWLVVGFLLVLLLHVCFTTVLWLTAGSKITLLPVLGIAIAVAAAVNVFLYFAGNTFLCLMVCRLYRDAHAGHDQPLAVYDQDFAELTAAPRWKISRKLPLVTAAVAIVIAIGGVWAVVASTPFEDNVEITAHRAGALAAPENTLAAVEQALADGATYLEIDVQLTADGKIVVVHDADLMRLGGSPLVVAKSTFDELREIDIGSSFDPQFSDQRVATLDELIDAVDGQAVIIIELKCYDGRYKPLVEAVISKVQERDLYDQSVVMSLHLKELQEVRKRDPNITIGFVVANSLGNLTKLDVDFLAVKTSQATHALIASAHAVDKEIYVWTVNKAQQMESMIDRGVDNIITDDPALLVSILAERESLSSTDRLLLRFRSLYGSSP